MSDSRFARKVTPANNSERDFRNSPILCLCRVMFDLPEDGDTQILDAAGIKWEGPDYETKEFAAHLGVSWSAVYKWLSEVAYFPAQYLAEFIAFVRVKSEGKDDRLARYFAGLSGYADKVDRILAIIEGRE